MVVVRPADSAVVVGCVIANQTAMSTLPTDIHMCARTFELSNRARGLTNCLVYNEIVWDSCSLVALLTRSSVAIGIHIAIRTDFTSLWAKDTMCRIAVVAVRANCDTCHFGELKEQVSRTTCRTVILRVTGET